MGVNDQFNGSLKEVYEIMKDAILIFIIATGISILLYGLGEYIQDNTFWDRIVIKIAEAFTFVGAAGLTGAMFIILNKYKALK